MRTCLLVAPRRRFAAALHLAPRRRFAAALHLAPRRRFAAALHLVVALAGLAACKFDTSANHADGPKLRPVDHGAMDGGNGSGSSPDGASGAVGGDLRDAASSTPAPDGSTALVDSSVPLSMDASSGDAGSDDAGQFGDNPTPDDPTGPAQNGGLKCADVFCPFAVAPIEPCCTTAADVTGGAAREADRCGLSLDKLSSDFYGTQCWQRDQPGVVDENCSSVQVASASEDPGCCSDEGYCGGVDSQHGLGCHYDPNATQQSCGTAVDPQVDAGAPACDVTGQYALLYDIDLAWGGRSGGLWDLTDDGRGTQRIALLATIESVEAGTLAISGSLRTCAVELPSFFSTTLCEAYQPIFPSKIWEASEMPTFPINGHLQCEQPGCIATIDAQTVLLGMSLDNPESPWPTAAQTANVTCPAGKGEACFPDHDGDSRPGVTVEIAKTGTSPAGAGSTSCRSGYTKKGPPLSSSVAAIFDGVRRTDRVLLGMRMKVGGAVTLGDECATGGGSGIAQFVNSRGWGCLVQPGTANYPWRMLAGPNVACTAAEAQFMDANLPIYEILPVGAKPPTALTLANTSASKGPLVRLVRLGALGSDVTCADVRAAMAP